MNKLDGVQIQNPNTTKLKGILQNPKPKINRNFFVVFEFWISLVVFVIFGFNIILIRIYKSIII